MVTAPTFLDPLHLHKGMICFLSLVFNIVVEFHANAPCVHILTQEMTYDSKPNSNKQ